MPWSDCTTREGFGLLTRLLKRTCSMFLSMDMKRLAFSEPFLSHRRKVFSGFSLGVAVSLIFLTLLFFCYSLRSPKFEAFLPGFDSVGQNLSFSSCPFNNNNNNHSSSESKPSSVSFIENGNNASMHAQKTVSESDKGDFFDPNIVSEKSDVENSSRIAKDVGLHDAETRVASKSNLSGEGTQKTSEGDLLKNNNVGNSSYKGKHGRDLSKKNNATVAHNDSKVKKVQVGLYDKCDIFDGNWVKDDSKPYYPSGSCPFIDRDFDCYLNGRPDGEYVKWKWQPKGCNIPSLNATDFLERLRGQRLVFVGDSLNRNMWESLVCILRQSIRNKKHVYEISGKSQFKKKGVYSFRFEDYNSSVDFVHSPFLVQESTSKSKNGSFETLRLDLIDQTTTKYQDADIVVFNTGHWWTHEKTSKGEDYYQEGNHVYPRLKVLDAYTRALNTWAKWVDRKIDVSQTQVFFRGYSITHFWGGQWNSGGQCHNETEPIFNESYLQKYPSKMRAVEHVIQNMKTPVIYMNVSRLTDYRKDGHPSLYRKEYKTAATHDSAALYEDCSHWCLPGVPDTWNELLYVSLLKYGKRSWKS
ncbi:unnamed protein product [Lupinus luteus]|uniref:Trichome birefringence-like N-terminal domain-containing protein n=1 Tax=Lupinus luteus TaxID=3873 RepID=A0AAV1WWP5_LUPLU